MSYIFSLLYVYFYGNVEPLPHDEILSSDIEYCSVSVNAPCEIKPSVVPEALAATSVPDLTVYSKMDQLSPPRRVIPVYQKPHPLKIKNVIKRNNKRNYPNSSSRNGSQRHVSSQN